MILRAEARTVRLVLSDAGVREAKIIEGASAECELTLHRSLEAHAGDVTMSWDPHRLAAHTHLTVGTASELGPWGLPPASVVERAAATRMVLRLHCTGSPFGARPLSFDLIAEGSTLRSAVADGPADVEVRSDWHAACRWLTTPELLFADAVPSSIGLRGDIALLSMFEGLIWEVTCQRPVVAGPVLRWGQLWASGAVRRDLAQLAPVRANGRPGSALR